MFPFQSQRHTGFITNGSCFFFLFLLWLTTLWKDIVIFLIYILCCIFSLLVRCGLWNHFGLICWNLLRAPDAAITHESTTRPYPSSLTYSLLHIICCWTLSFLCFSCTSPSCPPFGTNTNTNVSNNIESQKPYTRALIAHMRERHRQKKKNQNTYIHLCDGISSFPLTSVLSLLMSLLVFLFGFFSLTASICVRWISPL